MHRQFVEDRVGQHRAVGDEDGAGHRVVLGLGQQVGGGELRVGGLVGDEQRFGRAGELVDGDDAVDPALGEDDEDVAGAIDLVDVRHGSVPKAIAAIACAPPIWKTRSTLATSAAARMSGEIAPSGPPAASRR